MNQQDKMFLAVLALFVVNALGLTSGSLQGIILLLITLVCLVYLAHDISKTK